MKLVRVFLGVLLVVALLAVVGPFLIPVSPLEGLVPPRQLADPDSKFIEVDGLQLHYKEAGGGLPAMILLHGFSSSTFSWREVAGPLSALGTVVSYDRPSSGLTERPMPGHQRMEGGAAWTGVNPYSPQAQANQVVEMMDKLGLEKAILVGNSAGGTIAMLTALEHPDRVQGLVLVSPAIYTGGGAPAWIRPSFNTPQFQRIGPLSGRLLAGSGDRLLTMAWHDPSKATPDVLAGYRKATQAENWDRGLWELTMASQQLNLSTRLAQVFQPTLVITGDDDRIVPTADSVRLVGELPNADLLVIPQCGHVSQEECPEPWLDAVTEFVKQF